MVLGLLDRWTVVKWLKVGRIRFADCTRAPVDNTILWMELPFMGLSRGTIHLGWNQMSTPVQYLYLVDDFLGASSDLENHQATQCVLREV